MLWICKGCTTAYSVGAPVCPQCGSKKHAEQGAKDDPTLAPAPVEAPETPEETPDEP